MSLNWLILWDPQPWPEGSYEQGLSFCPEVFLELALWFFPELNMVLGVHMVLWQLDLLKNIFASKNGENSPSLRFFKYMWKFCYYFLSQFGL